MRPTPNSSLETNAGTPQAKISSELVLLLVQRGRAAEGDQPIRHFDATERKKKTKIKNEMEFIFNYLHTLHSNAKHNYVNKSGISFRLCVCVLNIKQILLAV